MIGKGKKENPDKLWIAKRHKKRGKNNEKNVMYGFSVLKNKQYDTVRFSLLHYLFQYKVKSLLLSNFYWAKCQSQKDKPLNCIGSFLACLAIMAPKLACRCTV